MVYSASVVWDCFKKVLPTENSNIFLVHHSDFLHSIFYNSSLPYTYALKAAFNVQASSTVYAFSLFLKRVNVSL